MDEESIGKMFDEFWESYPKRVGKAQARVLFKRIVTGGMKSRSLCKDSGMYIELFLEATPEQLIKAAKLYYASMRKEHGFGFRDDGKYLLNPTTFLNGRYEDFLD